MHFINYEFLILIVPISTIFLYLDNSKQIHKTILHQNLIINNYSNNKSKIYLIFILMIIALSRPVIDKEPIKTDSFKYEIVIGVDISASMKADDFKPSRFKYASNKLKEFLKISNNFFSIVAFTTNSLILSPFTDDSEILYYMFDSFDIDNVISKGTDIMTLLKTTNKIIKSKDKILILFTDGGDKKDFIEELKFIEKNRIKLIVIPCATNKGTTLYDENNHKIRKDGKIFISSYNSQIESIATLTTDNMSTLNRYIESLKIEKIKTQDIEYNYQELFYYPLILSTLLLLSFYLNISKFKNLTPILILLITTKSHSSIMDSWYFKQGLNSYNNQKYKDAINSFKKINSNIGKYNLGNAYYKNRDYKKAFNSYKLIKSSDINLQANTLFNMGNSLLKSKKFKKAYEFYQKSLILRFDKETLYNRNIAKKFIKKNSIKSKSENSKNSANNNQNKENVDKKYSKKVVEKNNSNSKSNISNIDNNFTNQEIENSKKSQILNQKRVFSYEQYRLINRGKSNENTPW